MDGSGVFQVNSNAKYARQDEQLFKSGNDFSYFLWEADTSKALKPSRFMDNYLCNAVIGHVRASTVGSNSAQNAHPFNFPNLVGAHNGTLQDKKYLDIQSDKTDSELMFKDMNERGIVPVLAELDKNSAYAVTIYDRKSQRMIFARNSKRTLWFCVLEDRDVIYWASEAWMLTGVTARSGLKHKTFALKPGVVLELNPANIKLRDGQYFNILHDFNPPEVETVVVQTGDNASKKVSPGNSDAGQKENKGSLPETKTLFDAKVIPFAPPERVEAVPIKDKVEGNRLNSFCVECSCGKHHLDLFHSYQIRNGRPGYPKYDHNSDTYDCVSCEINIENKEVMQ